MVEHNPRLTSSEIAMLWGTYVEDTMSKYFLQYSLEIVKDNAISTVLQKALQFSEDHIQQIAALFTKEKIPIPQGFTENDVDLKAPRLYSDNFHLRYIHRWTRAGIATYGVAKTTSARSDVRNMFSQWLSQTSQLYDDAVKVMLEKGTLVRSPMIPYPTKVEFVHSKDYYSGILGDTRPLSALEIAHIATNIETNFIGMTMLMGFSQTSDSQKVAKYMEKGMKIAKKHGEVFSAILRKDDVSAPSSWDSAVSGSQTQTFSDKMMMFFVSTLNSIGMGNYGLALGASMRSDLVTQYTRLLLEIGTFSKEGSDILIEHGWMEKPPHALDRKKLSKGK